MRFALALALVFCALTIPAAMAQATLTIGGSPAAVVATGDGYNFSPRGTLAGAGQFWFEIENKPAWLDFDRALGRLSGTPRAENVGTYGNIRITLVNAGQRAVLGPFSIAVVAPPPRSVQVTWTRPDRNVDGSVLQDLAGYVIYVGKLPYQLRRYREVPDPAATSSVVGDLTDEDHYFAVAAYNQQGMQSAFSVIASTLP